MPHVHYREHLPPPDLAGRLECVWTLRSEGRLPAAVLNRVLPDGCTDVIFDAGEPPPADTGPHHRLRSCVVGAMLRPAAVWMAGEVDLLGVRFRPGGAAALLPLPLAEITDAVVPLEEVWGALAGELESRVLEARGAERVRIVEEALRRRASGRAAHPAVARASARIARSHGSVAVEALAAETGTSRRHLERLFAEQVGLSPKAAARVARFRRLCDLLRARPGAGWSRLALECGYHDQAHMIREFRGFAGLTPEAYRREHARVASVQYAASAGG
ncbi:MAG TPA: AraC family transcriptional regulator [Longimicrobiaceae bacterium]|nr:AraC family transcriptional regulator [Longimicrobiaceae bacterium]